MLDEAPVSLRARKERLAAAIREKRCRIDRRKQSSPNGGLIEFIRYFWHVLEPVDPFVEGWPLECLCAHLEAITRGDIIEIAGDDRRFNRLLANVPPGFMKSLCTEVFWKAWEWGPMGLPHLRYVSFSYSPELTERDNAKLRDLVLSQPYRELWGHVFNLVGDGKIRITNDKTGFSFATSFGGVGTGERGHRVICLPYSEPVLTSSGYLPIGEIVTNRLPVKIAGFDHASGKVVWQDIEEYELNPGSEIIEIECDEGSLRCTGDHPVFVSGRGYARADSIKSGEQIYGTGRDFVLPPMQDGNPAQPKRASEILQQGLQACFRGGAFSPDKQQALCDLRNDGLSTSRTHEAVERNLLQPRMLWKGKHWTCKSSLRWWPSVVRMQMVQEAISKKTERRVKGGMLLQSMRDALSVGLRGILARTPARMGGVRLVQSAIQALARRHPILFPLLCEQCTFGSHQRRGEWPLCSWAGSLSLSQRMEGGLQGSYSDAGWGTLPAVQRRARPISTPRSSHRLREGESRPEQPDNALSVLSRQDAREREVAGGLEKRTVRSVRKIGRVERTYNLNVTPCHNYFANAHLVHNCDDPHKLKGTQETTEARATITTWVREAMQNRLNDLQRDAIVIIMQRLYEDDASGEVMKHLGDEYCNLIIPMEYEANRHFSHYTGWNGGQDPRTEDGELAWEARYPAQSLASFKRNNYLWSGQYQQSPVPRGGGIILEEWWQPWTEDQFPSCEYRWAFADTAYTKDDNNDPTGFTLWGLFYENGDPKVILMDAWRKRLELHGPNKWTENKRTRSERLKRIESWAKVSWSYHNKTEGSVPPIIAPEIEPWLSYVEDGHNSIDKWPNESRPVWIMRTQEKWGLCEWMAHSCQRLGVHKLIVEAKASGLSVVQELQRLHGTEGWGIEAKAPKGDKYARLCAVQSLFSQSLVYAPEREWSQMVIDEVASFPKGSHDDLTDSTSGALEHVRSIGLLITKEQRQVNDQQLAMYQRPTKSLYPV